MLNVNQKTELFLDPNLSKTCSYKYQKKPQIKLIIISFQNIKTLNNSHTI